MALRVFLAFALVLACFPGVPKSSGEEPARLHPASVLLKTELGGLVIRLDWTNAPENSAAFVRYVQEGMYAQTSFDDTDKFCLYGGKPSQRTAGIASNGNMIATAGPPGEFKLPNRRGAVGFRRTAGSCNPDKRSNCTQIYVMLTDHPQADGDFSVFGALEAEPSVFDAIEASVLKHVPVPFTVELREK